MTGSLASLRRAIAIRDAFLERVATKLGQRVEALAAARSARERRELLHGLVGFAAELELIATPSVPVVAKRAPVDLVAWLAKTLGDPGVAASGLEVEIAETTGAALGRWDEAHLESIFGELLSNALKYSAGQPVRVAVEVGRGRARLVIENTGAWSGPRGRVGRFAREERRATVQGYGIGVWLARRLARANGGRLSFASDGKVTTAVLTLDLDASTRARARGATLEATVRVTLRARRGAKPSSSRRSARSSAATR